MFRHLAIAALFVGAASASPVGLDEWDLTKSAWKGQSVRARSGGLEASLGKAPNFDVEGGWDVAGGQGIALSGVDPGKLPTRQIAVEAQVAIDAGQKWGGIYSFAQDNGGYERGWLLGYNEQRFVFWISTGGRMLEVTSETAFQKGRFYHVVGTYDGSAVRLYIDGALEAERQVKGKIVYPDSAFYAVGVYKDKDEHYPSKVKLKRVALFKDAPTGKWVRERAKAAGVETPLEFAVQPALEFVSPTTARVTWESAAPGGAAVNFGDSRRLGTVVKSESAGGVHSVLLEGLQPETAYFYKIGWTARGERAFSPVFEFDTSLNFSKPEVAGEAGAEANKVLERTGVRKGYALVLGEMALALDLARASELVVAVVVDDVAAARRQLYEAGAHGARVTALASPEVLGDSSVNLLVGRGAIEAAEVQRLLVPGRGKAFFIENEKTVGKPRAEGAGDWTHQYGDGGNSSSSGDRVGGATKADDFELAWLGRPGADFGIDRNPRMPAPLSAGGRLFHQGLNRLIALDAQNGAVLWGLEVPDLRRINLPRDCSNWCADGEHLFVAIRDRAWELDAETGERTRTFASDDGLEWGYIAREGRMLVGSGVQKKAAYANFWGGSQWFDGKGGEAGTEKVCSDVLFGYSLDSADQKPAWTYNKGVVLNPTIAVADGRVTFLETRNSEVKEGRGRRLKGAPLWKEQFVVTLDARTGERLWERPVELEHGTASAYLQIAEGRVVVATSNSKFHLYTFAAESGEPGWSNSLTWADDHHSGHIQHPVVTGGKLYLAPHGIDMATGEVKTTKVGKREGCHTYVGAGGALLYRGVGRVVSLWDAETETVSNWPRLRPSCWLSTIPASGMLLFPEGGGGCSCGGWMETSIGMRPRINSGGGGGG